MKIILAYFEDLVGASGGLERTLCNLANEMVSRGHSVQIVTFDRNQGEPFYKLDSKVVLVNMQKESHQVLNRKDKIKREIYRLFGDKAVRVWKEKNRNRNIPRCFKQIVDDFKPDVIVSFNHETSGEIYKSGVTNPYISCFRNDPNLLCKNMLAFEKEAIKRSAAVQVLIPQFIDVVKEKIRVDNVIYIPNAVPQASETVDLGMQKKVYKIVEVARLNKKQKRQQIIIEAFSKISRNYPNWIVELWGADTSGTGKFLRALIKKYHLEDKVFLKGVTKDVASVYADADIFCFPSIYEGFPNALAEAMTAGLPVVGCRNCPSVKWLIREGKNGLLADESIDDYAKKLEILMRDESLRQRFGEQAHETMKKYSPQKIWDEWERLLYKVAKGEVDG